MQFVKVKKITKWQLLKERLVASQRRMSGIENILPPNFYTRLNKFASLVTRSKNIHSSKTKTIG